MGFGFWKKTPPPPSGPSSILDVPVWTLNGLDWLTLRNLTEGGVWVGGSTGSGKTFSLRCLMRLFLKLGLGGIVTTCKPEDVTDWQRIAEECGRENDLILVDASGRHSFNFMAWQAAHPGAGLTHNLVQLFLSLLDLEARQNGQGGDRFWMDAAQEVLTHAIEILAACDSLSLENAARFIATAPRSPEERDSSAWRGSFCFQCIAALESKRFDTWRAADLKESVSWVLHNFPLQPPKTRECVVMLISGIAGKLLRRPFRQLLSHQTTFTPEDSLCGKIILLALPTKIYGDAGRIAQTLILHCWMQAMERREDRTHPDFPPVFLWSDEHQNFFAPATAIPFQSTCRSSRVITTYLTQGITHYTRTGDAKAKAEAMAFLQNVSTKLLFSSSCVETNQWFSQLCGQSYRFMPNFNRSAPQDQGDPYQPSKQSPSFSAGASKQLVPDVLPSEFSRLLRPRENGYAEAILFKDGAQWQQTGKPWLRVRFYGAP